MNARGTRGEHGGKHGVHRGKTGGTEREHKSAEGADSDNLFTERLLLAPITARYANRHNQNVLTWVEHTNETASNQCVNACAKHMRDCAAATT